MTRWIFCVNLTKSRTCTYNRTYKEQIAMNVITYTQARQKLKDLMDRVTDDNAPVRIARGGHPPVVMMSLEDFESLEETLHLIRSPENAKRLAKGMDSLKKKRT